ncbi:hypothetical protein JJQ72_01215 [Paenibacillus sp. F411]|uniref:hypothetical protein n=1 Tax=Paenibacillus sp. F411 TaxID=2820239 RepID=UPI001AAE4ACC|nr:hypothetical protein [Paenibacillus sp. F411]MBO2942607.1 hypothetical protein [Paenibacillus sp. F411]
MAVSGMSTEDRSLIRSYMLLRFTHRVFERDCRIIQESGVFKTPELYVELVGNGAKKTALMLKEIKLQFATRTIKIIEITRSADGVQARYACRGYIGTLQILWPCFQQEVMSRMRAYLGLHLPEAPQAEAEISAAPACPLP